MKIELSACRVIDVVNNKISTKYKHILERMPDVVNRVISYTSFLPVDATLYERVYCVLHDVQTTPVCSHCALPMTFSVGKKCYGRYHRHCSQRDATVRHRYVESMLGKYGVSAPMQNTTIRRSISTTMEERHGVPFYTMAPSLRDANSVRYGGVDVSTNKILHAVEYVNDPAWLASQNSSLPLKWIAADLSVSPSLIQKRFKRFGITPKRHFVSAPELELHNLLVSLGADVQQRQIVNGVEVDLLVNGTLGVEVDGLYWHGELKGKHRRYHINKTEACASVGVKLLHITDYEWITKQDIVISRLRSAVGDTVRVQARKCTIVSLNTNQRRAFFNAAHIQGDVGASVAYGLVFDGTLVFGMSFGKPRYNKAYEWELIRMSSAINHTVVGGASKLLAHFTARHPGSIISYSDNRWGTGKVYSQLGFKFISNSNPNYFYFHSNYVKTGVHSRVKFQKHKLLKLFPSSTSDMTEWTIMQQQGYDRYWDCGNGVWVLD